MKHQEIIAKMTIEEKASLMSGKDFWETKEIKKYDIPSVFIADGPHGVRRQAVGGDHIGYNPSIPATCYPVAAAMANSWDEELGFQLGEYLGKEAACQKVSVLLGPGVNIKRNPLCGRNFEYFSEDPYLSGKMAAAYIRGIQSNGVNACVKHFAANNQEERRMVIDTVVDERTLREIYLTAFEIAVKEGNVKFVMSSYNRLNGIYTNENIHLLHEILRDEWGFDGLVITDWGGSNDRVQGLIAGNELEMPGTGGETDQEIVDAVRNGKIDEALLDECVDRLLTMLMETKRTAQPDAFDIEAHHAMARKAAEQSIVLLKNKDEVLPLNKSLKVAVIGDFAKTPRYQGAGSSGVNPTKLDSILECLGDYDLNYVGYAPGFRRYGGRSKKLKNRAYRLAEKSDVLLLFMGLDEVTETEGMDRSNMSIPANQIELLDELADTGKKIVVVLSCGSAVETKWADYADAVVHAYLSGQAGARAILNVITGKVNPSGKLAESYPLKYRDTPSASNFHKNELTVEYREGVYVGYRYFDTAGMKVRYPFGFGLSYTTFLYSDIHATDQDVSFTLENTGEMAGAEIAQLYIGMPDSGIFRPKKELKGFKKLFLQPGEKRRIVITFDDKSFRYFNVKTNQWETETGIYEIMIGASSADIRLRATVVRKGTPHVLPYRKEVLPSYYSGQSADVSTEEFETLIGRNVPCANLTAEDYRHMNVGVNTTIAQLRYARGWTGRFFEGGLRFAYNFLRLIGKRYEAMMLMVGLYHEPMRGLSRMTNGAICWGQLQGLLLMFNGHFFKGLGRFVSEGKKRTALVKAQQLEKIADSRRTT